MKRSTICAATLGLHLIAAPTTEAKGLDGFRMGLNGVLTAPADPIDGLIHPPDSYDELFLAPVTAPLLGFVRGTLLGLYRASSGLVDIAMTPLWVLPEISPEARFRLVIGDSQATVRIPLSDVEGTSRSAATHIEAGGVAPSASGVMQICDGIDGRSDERSGRGKR